MLRFFFQSYQPLAGDFPTLGPFGGLELVPATLGDRDLDRGSPPGFVCLAMLKILVVFNVYRGLYFPVSVCLGYIYNRPCLYKDPFSTSTTV